ncbi:gliding motility-associated C-terminal domain-containing protein [Sanyastnella coralliicola]|uniref:gliding motility-associated C-terminal domain-containing protein n=1 Tax=Sanyastnella coralliicola TaxID=3069118 RepID=UPI0027BA9A0D|nr:gliding motility-associated C-terminal domain-containing protein [Longitalea sp. SCSIO 12813]
MLLNLSTLGQNLVYEDSFVGGVTANGFGQDISGGGTGDIELDIAPGSTIREAWILVGRFGAAPDITFTMNGIPYELNAGNQVSETFNVEFYGGDSGVHGIEVTDDIDPNVNTYTIEIATQGATSNRYQSFYLFVAFENDDLDAVNTYLYANNDDDFPSQNFLLSDLAPFPDDGDIVVSSFSSYACDIDFDGQLLDVNGTNVGIMGGADAGSSFCSSVIGSFNYENGVATGLNDDVANATVDAADGLVVINDYVDANDTGVDLIFYDGPGELLSSDNIQWAASLTYGSSCEVPAYEVSEDASICPGQEITLSASGGQSYEWSSDDPLDTTDEDSITISPEETTDYQVAISFANGCSASETITITVDNGGASIEAEVTNILCNTAGSISALANNLTEPLSWEMDGVAIADPSVTIDEPGEYVFTVTDANGCAGEETFEVILDNGNALILLEADAIVCELSSTIVASAENLEAPISWVFEGNAAEGPSFEVNEPGIYSVSVTDANGCEGNAEILVEQVTQGTANFDVISTDLSAPAEVTVLNTSIDLDEITWYSDDEIETTEEATFNYLLPGEYEIMLVGTNSITGCIDSISVRFDVLPEAALYVPNAFTPDGDGINEVFLVDGIGIDASRFQLDIFNRWGDLVFTTTDPSVGWVGNVNGGEYFAPDGVYVYVINWAKYDQPDLEQVSGHITLIR